MRDVVEILQRVGVASYAELTLYTSARSIRSALSGGQIRRVGKGIYALPVLAESAVAAAHGGVLSHESAAMAWGFAVVRRPDLPHVTIPRGWHGRAMGLPCHLHRQDAPSLDGRTTPLRTVLDCARTLPFSEALAIADSALRIGSVARSELRSAADGLRGPGSRRIKKVADLADPRAESALESLLRARLIDGNIRGFVPQLVIADDDFHARVDLACPIRRIILEAEGFAFHGSREAFRQDCRRYTNLVMRGWIVVRFSWEDVFLEENWVSESVRAVIRGRPRPHNGLKTAA